MGKKQEDHDGPGKTAHRVDRSRASESQHGQKAAGLERALEVAALIQYLELLAGDGAAIPCDFLLGQPFVVHL